MTEEKAIKILEQTKRNCGLPEQGDTWKPNAETIALDIAINALEKQKYNGWIPCSERLPEESLNGVIGWDEYRKRCVFVQYIRGEFQIAGKDDSFNITAWQPAPEHYKECEK